MRNYFLDFYWLVRSKMFDGLCFARDRLVEYGDLRFAKADVCLRRWSRKHNFRRHYLSFVGGKDNELLEPYGETPIKTMRKIVRSMGILPGQKVMELGAGRGRIAIWLATQVGCKVVAVEHAPFMVELGKSACECAGISEEEIKWICSDFAKAPFEEVDLVYLYGTGLPDILYEKLCLRFRQMKRPPHIITVGGPLSEYDSLFSAIQVTSVVFPWGWTYAYLNTCKPQD